MGLILRPIPRSGVVRTSVYQRVEAAVQYTLALRHGAAFDQISSRIGKEVSLTTMEPNDFVLIGVDGTLKARMRTMRSSTLA